MLVPQPSTRHLGRAEERLPTHQGFDEWYGIPRTYTEALWPYSNETNSLWPSFGAKQGGNADVVPPEPIYEARRGEKARPEASFRRFPPTRPGTPDQYVPAVHDEGPPPR